MSYQRNALVSKKEAMNWEKQRHIGASEASSWKRRSSKGNIDMRMSEKEPEERGKNAT